LLLPNLKLVDAIVRLRLAVADRGGEELATEIRGEIAAKNLT